MRGGSLADFECGIFGFGLDCHLRRCRDGAVLFESGLFSTGQIDQLRDNKVVADCCGVFFMADGNVADIPLNGCTPCVKPNEMPNTDITLLAGGPSKSVGTLAVLRANFIDRLFVDENLARKLTVFLQRVPSKR